LVGSIALLAAWTAWAAAPPAPQALVTEADKQFQAGNVKDAYESYRKAVLDPTFTGNAGHAIGRAVDCLQRLGRVSEIDALFEQIADTHAARWSVLHSLAEAYRNIPHDGFIVAGKFERGPHRGGGEHALSHERDRVRALQLYQQAMPLINETGKPAERADFYIGLSRMLRSDFFWGQTQPLQFKTDLSKLPDYERGAYRYQPRVVSAAPVDAEGNPIYYHVPESWDAATSDGARWRWAINSAAVDATHERVLMQFQAEFYEEQFGVQTMAQYGYAFGGYQAEDDAGKRSQTYALHTLSDDETIARLATGVRRFKLPDEFNPIKIYRRMMAGDDGIAEVGYDLLSRLYENRRQYDRAAEVLREAIAKFPSRGNTAVRKQRLNQIVGNWGRFENCEPQPAGRGATLEFRFRNAKSVEFTAHALKIDALLADLKAYLKADPKQLDWQKLDVNHIGYRLVEKNEKQYLGEMQAEWKMELEPRPRHFDRRVTVAAPLTKAGAYLVTAKLPDGNVSRIVLWLADTVIAKKPLSGKQWVYVADAVTGKPIPKANVEFFGYRQRHTNVPVFGNRWTIDTANFAEFTDADGQVQLKVDDDKQGYQWLIMARTEDGRLAQLGFTGLWRGGYHDQEYNQPKTYGITDRPVYRPEQKVQFKFWIRRTQYDKPESQDFADTQFQVELHDPQGTQLWSKPMRSDQYGGLAGDYELPSDAKLGVYQLMVHGHGGVSFRVEEYKKPEFEVKVEAPTEPVQLGEKITATLEAKYYFGAPVTEAKVKYKVLRSQHDAHWYPIARWDWLYGRGYWWFGYDYRWYPGFAYWGCFRPSPWWWHRAADPPEVVAEREVEIGPDGKLKIEIDTQLAQELHGDQDHRYEITAEVTDASRRTIVGSGEVLVARKPYRVFAWVDRGHYRVGDTIDAQFSAHTLSDKPVSGKGKLTLLALRYDADGKPIETPVQEWNLDTDAAGRAAQQLQASAAGQFRLSYRLTDGAGHEQEGGYLFTVTGEGFDGAQFRFNHLELVPEKREYAPGEKVRLLVNTDRVGSTVQFFLRPTNGVYLPPRTLRLTGKSTVVEFDVTLKDMPNFFVEAITVADGRLHMESKEIVVPPESRVVEVTAKPTKAEYLPGEAAEVELTLRDAQGRAFVGQTVVAIYDKAVEYVSGGSNVAEIKEFFWKWRRHHYPQTESSLQRWSHHLQKSNEIGMQNLGVFGATTADDLDEVAKFKGFDDGDKAERKMLRGNLGGVPGGAGFGGGFAAPMAAAAPMAEMNGLADAAGKPQADGRALGQKGQDGGVPAVQPTVRSNFADTALWVAALETNSDGVAKVNLKMPENLTTWKIRTWAMGRGTNVGESSVEVVTTKNLIVRLQAPRFFTEKDEVVLSAVVHNYLKTKKQVQVELQLDGPTLKPLDASSQSVEIAADGEARVDWRVKVVAEGEAVVRMRALTDEESDAVEQKFPVYVHGMLKTESFAGALRPADPSGRVTFDVPAERRVEQSRLEVRYSPTLAGAMVDALPYLVDYPYGCTEQTLSRFLPTVITQKVLLDMGLDLKTIRDKRTNLNAQEIGDDRDRAKQWKRFDRSPVFDEATVNKMVKVGVQRLTDMQCSDGGWGWFSGWGEHSYPHTTAYVVHGLHTALRNDVALVPGTLEAGVAWLKRYQAEQVRQLKNAPSKTRPYKTQADNLDAFVFMVLVEADYRSAEMLGFLERDRPQLSVYALSMYGMALHQLGEAEKLAAVLQNISQYVVEDDENQTAWLNLPESNYWWHWYGSENEAMAYYLKLLAKVDPQGRVAPRLVKYLLNNRKHGTYWKSTRDTALCIEALADYLKASGETRPDLSVEVWLDGAKRKEVKIDAENLFAYDNAFILEGAELASGRHTLELRKQGAGPLYFNAYVTNFTQEDFITKAGLEVKVERKYYKLERVDAETNVVGSRGQALSQKVEKYERRELPNLSTLKSGDLVEIELEIESKNDYEYLVFEDLKAAGFEPVDLRSGYNGNALGAYMELRDERVCFFARTLARGKHSVAYRLRAEIPGKFSALPTRAEAMYAPELRANSDEMKVNIED